MSWSRKRSVNKDGPCAVPGCDQPWWARLWCKRHYYRWKRNGDPTLVKDLRKHGETTRGRRTDEYGVWAGMIDRCGNPNKNTYHNYGARGIRVCDRWRTSYENFLADMGRRPSKRHTLDRIDNNGNYEPDNCRWATKREQCRNTRKNINITIDGVTRCASEWAEIMGFQRSLVSSRLKRGWSAREAVLEPVQQHIPRWKRQHERQTNSPRG